MEPVYRLLRGCGTIRFPCHRTSLSTSSSTEQRPIKRLRWRDRQSSLLQKLVYFPELRLIRLSFFTFHKFGLRKLVEAPCDERVTCVDDFFHGRLLNFSHFSTNALILHAVDLLVVHVLLVDHLQDSRVLFLRQSFWFLAHAVEPLLACFALVWYLSIEVVLPVNVVWVNRLH